MKTKTNIKLAVVLALFLFGIFEWKWIMLPTGHPILIPVGLSTIAE